MQNLVIETQIIEAHNQIGALQFSDEVVDLFFSVNPVIPACRAVSHAYAHAHLTDLVPPADFVGRFLRFQIKINSILHSVQQVRIGTGAFTLSVNSVQTKQKGKENEVV